ncbi:hypothetical protein SFC43_20830 [Bacteroides sp. CR5/BHMF/2]|nr:hypothetical protein [Bacteroides sp. CR5/BHMF/2]
MMALAGVYWTLATDHVYGERYSNILSNTDDLSYYARLNQSGQVYTNSHNSSNNDIYQTWTQLYSGINNANVLLDNIDAANIPDAAVKNRIKEKPNSCVPTTTFCLYRAGMKYPSAQKP